MELAAQTLVDAGLGGGGSGTGGASGPFGCGIRGGGGETGDVVEGGFEWLG